MLENQDELRGKLRGELILAGDANYDEARKLYNGMIDKRPGAIVRAVDVADVIAAVNYARDNNLLLAIRGGGHNGPGLGSCDGGLVIDLSRMRGVTCQSANEDGRGGRRMRMGRCGSCDASVWTGGSVWLHLHNRCGWPDAGRRHWIPHAKLRSHD